MFTRYGPSGGAAPIISLPFELSPACAAARDPAINLQAMHTNITAVLTAAWQPLTPAAAAVVQCHAARVRITSADGCKLVAARHGYRQPAVFVAAIPKLACIVYADCWGTDKGQHWFS